MWLVNAGGIGIVTAYAFVAVSFLVLRRREPDLERPFRIPGGNVVGVAALLLSLGLFVLYLPGSPAALVWPQEWLLVVVWTVLGAVLFFRESRKRSVVIAPRTRSRRPLLRTLLAGSLLLQLLACGPSGGEGEPADLILHGAKVVTLDSASSVHSAVAVRDGLILAVGDDTLLERYAAEETVDLEGQLLLPGFIDSHIHIDGEPVRYIPLEEVPSIAEIARRVASKAEELGPGEWITGYGWSEDDFEEGRKPTREDLDAAAPENPVVLTRAGAHSAVGNSLALELAGIDASTPDPEGGMIERDAAGEPTGIIRERHGLLLQLVPPASNEELVVSLRRNLNRLFSFGITSIVEANEFVTTVPLWEEVYDGADVPLPRAKLQLLWSGADTMRAFGRKTGDGDEHLALGAVKVFVDGGFTGPSAYTKEPYRSGSQPPGYRGKLNMSEVELERIVTEAHEAGWQLGIHAIGDAAIELTVDLLAQTLDASPREDHRHYLNHFTMMPAAATMETMAAYGIHITQQPNFTYTLEGRYREYLDGARLQHNNSLRSPMDHGVTVALSSDILPIGPMVGIYARRDAQGQER